MGCLRVGRDQHREGKGRVAWARVGRRTAVVGLEAYSPLKLLAPRARGETGASAVFTSTFGGGLVAGDEIAIDASCGAAAVGLLATQSATKVYRSTDGARSRQSLSAHVEDGAALLVLPDPVTCFAGAVYEQRQLYNLSTGAALIAIDWLTSGRRAAGERWAFARYDARTDVRIAGRLVFRDAMRLDPEDGPLCDPARLGAVDCLGAIVIVGERFEAEAERLLQWAGAQPVGRDAPLIFSASPLPSGAGGAVIRVAGRETESVGHWMRQRLSFIAALIGADPWRGK